MFNCFNSFKGWTTIFINGRRHLATKVLLFLHTCKFIGDIFEK